MTAERQSLVQRAEAGDRAAQRTVDSIGWAFTVLGAASVLALLALLAFGAGLVIAALVSGGAQ